MKRLAENQQSISEVFSTKHMISLNKKLPVYPLENAVLLPGVMLPLTMQRDPLALFQNGSHVVAVKTKELQTNTINNVNQAEKLSSLALLDVGCLAEVAYTQRLSVNSWEVILQGKDRVKLKNYPADHQHQPYATVSYCDHGIHEAKKWPIEVSDWHLYIEKMEDLNWQEDPDFYSILTGTQPKILLVDILAQLLLKTEEQQYMLETFSLKKRIEMMCSVIQKRWFAHEPQKINPLLH